jgi:hypothetical protein
MAIPKGPGPRLSPEINSPRVEHRLWAPLYHVETLTSPKNKVDWQHRKPIQNAPREPHRSSEIHPRMSGRSSLPGK